MELKPGPKTRVANMMTISMLKTVKELQKELREARPGPIPTTAVTNDIAVQKLCKIDERRGETYWVEEDGHQNLNLKHRLNLNTLTSIQGCYRVFGSIPVSRLQGAIKGSFKAIRYYLGD